MHKLTDDEKLELQKKLLLLGAKDFTSDFFNTEEYKELRHDMMDHLDTYDDERIRFKLLPMSTVLKAGKYVIDKHTRGINIKVAYTNLDFLRSDVIARYSEKPKRYEYDEMIRFIEDNVQQIDITDVPIMYEGSDKHNGFAAYTYFFGTDNIDLAFYKKLGAFLSKIKLEGSCNENTQLTYVHELYHGLLGRNKGAVNNLLHNETLPIFMEKVAASDLDSSERLLNLRTLDRLLNTKNNIMIKTKNDFFNNDRLGTITNEGYIISTLLATALFDVYEHGTSQTQRKIDDAINKVLVGDGQLEDVFDKYEATEEKGSILVRKQLKQYSK